VVVAIKVAISGKEIMSFVLMVRNLAAFLALICAAKAGAQFPASQVVAESQGIAVAISNWTPFMVNSSFTATATGISGPGFPVSIPRRGRIVVVFSFSSKFGGRSGMNNEAIFTRAKGSSAQEDDASGEHRSARVG